MITTGKKVTPKLIKSFAEGLLAYRIFLSKCAVSSALSEHSFYESGLRILNSRKEWYAKCEFPISKNGKGKGDNKRIDFVIFSPVLKEKRRKNGGLSILASIELKAYLSNGNSPNLKQIIKDNNKLIDFQNLIGVGKHNSWILVIHSSGDKLKRKLEKHGFSSYSTAINCVNQKYQIEIIKVQKYFPKP